ncbi:MAG TPA: hypothetical protein VIJ79_03895 [Acidobacteriaceae bacterium]
MKHIETLKDVIRKLHGVESTHRESVPVTETWKGQTIWDGIVEVFTLHGHPETDTAYAWSHDTDDPQRPQRHVTVLHVDPAVSPLLAVRAAILKEYRDAQTA